jgi:hypothetical protein
MPHGKPAALFSKPAKLKSADGHELHDLFVMHPPAPVRSSSP